MNFEKARYNMVEQQIRPWEVVDFDLLDVLFDLPRELFVTEEYKDFSYSEINIPLPNGSIMLEPKIAARMMQNLSLNKNKSVLEIATGSGYSTAVLASLAKEVDTIDIDATQLDRAKEVLIQLNINNVRFIHDDGLEKTVLEKLNKKYDAIILGGAVHELPEFLTDYLHDGGVLIAIIGSHPVMRAVKITKNSQHLERKNIFDTLAPYLTENKKTKKNLFEF